MNTAEQSLESAKRRLKEAFSKLEDAIDKRVEKADNKAKIELTKFKEQQLQGDTQRQKLEAITKKFEHALEENSELHTLLGKEREQTKKLRHVNETAEKQVDSLLQHLEPLLEEKDEVKEPVREKAEVD